MNKEQLTKISAWFDKFVAGFYGSDEFINTNIKMKDNHTRRVSEEMLYLAGQLELDENQRMLAETIGLLHDIGRFPQFIKYKTYNDTRSINHCELALEIIQKENLLAGLPPVERKLIETAVKHHGEKSLSGDLPGDTMLFSQMIRDADKLDIYNVVTKAYAQYRNNPSGFRLEIEFPDLPGYSPHILDAVLSGRLIEYKSLRSWNDMKLCILGWVYDINFPESLKRIKERRHIEEIFKYLPDTPDTAKVRDKILSYVKSRISQNH